MARTLGDGAVIGKAGASRPFHVIWRFSLLVGDCHTSRKLKATSNLYNLDESSE
jgi:hypothetical protein